MDTYHVALVSETDAVSISDVERERRPSKQVTGFRTNLGGQRDG